MDAVASGVFWRRTKRCPRTAKSCGPEAAMLASSLREVFAGDGDNKPAHRGEHEVSRKAIAQGMSECFRSPVCSCAPNAHFLAHETAGAARTRHSLLPLFQEGQRIWKARAKRAARMGTMLSSSRGAGARPISRGGIDCACRLGSTALRGQQREPVAMGPGSTVRQSRYVGQGDRATHSTFARTNSARSALVACTVSIASSAAPSSCATASSCSAAKFHPLDRGEIGDELVGLADGADGNDLAVQLDLECRPQRRFRCGRLDRGELHGAHDGAGARREAVMESDRLTTTTSRMTWPSSKALRKRSYSRIETQPLEPPSGPSR